MFCPYYRVARMVARVASFRCCLANSSCGLSGASPVYSLPESFRHPVPVMSSMHGFSCLMSGL